MVDFHELMGRDSPYEFSIGLSPGTRYEAPPPYPDLKIKSSKVMQVRRILYQEIEVEAERIEDNELENIKVFRLVAELEDDREVLLEQFALPSNLIEDSKVDITTCEGCGGTIPPGEHEIYEGKAYHKRCIED